MGIGAAIGGALGGMFLSSAMSPSMDMPKPPAPAKPPQAAKTPEVATMRRQNAVGAAAGPSAGPSSTFLTGPTGINPALLSLGKSTLLGQ
jgi:hypothetical protein